MIVIWEKFVNDYTNLGNLIQKFKSLPENLIKIWKNLRKILMVLL